jgi:hypothetical protein
LTRAISLLAVTLALTASAGAAPSKAWHGQWLCMPGTANDWCSVDLTTTIWSANGTRRNLPVSVPPSPPIDCFYVYPSVAEDYAGNAPLKVEPEERETAITQAARFSHVCRVYAPLYRQVSAHAGTIGPFGLKIPPGNYQYEVTDVRAAWHDYLAHYNGGRGVVLIGHSEGAGLLRDLLADEYSKFRKVFISAILLGGTVNVDAQNRFHGIPACTSPSELRCIVAYSSWDKTPPASANFEHVSASSQHILCVNPASLAGGSAPITPIFAGINPQGIVPYGSVYVTYHWVEFPGLYTAKCVRAGSRAWLLVSRISNPGDKRPTVVEALGKDWGLHAADVNMTLADLVNLVAAQSQSWLRH